MVAELNTAPIIVTRDGPVMMATINRPARKNALNIAAYRELIAFLRAADADPAVGAMIITGAGGNFTSGNDLADFAAAKTPEDARIAISFLLTISALQKPVLAAVEGHAVGIGVTMLLHCDFAYAGAETRFRLPFISLGLTPEGASSLLLPAIAGSKRAAELLLLGEVFSAEVAYEAGLLTKVTAPGQSLEAALATAQKLAALPGEAMRQSKQLLRRSTTETIRETIVHEAEVFGERLTSPEAQAAFLAFLTDKRG